MCSCALAVTPGSADKTAKTIAVANRRLEETVFRTSDRISSDLLNSKRKLMSTLTGGPWEFIAKMICPPEVWH